MSDFKTTIHLSKDDVEKIVRQALGAMAREPVEVKFKISEKYGHDERFGTYYSFDGIDIIQK